MDESQHTLAEKIQQYLPELRECDTEFTDDAMNQLIRILVCAMSHDTPAPSLSCDGEGGLFCEWLVDGERTTMEVDGAGTMYCTVASRAGDIIATIENAADLRAHLEQLTITCST